MTGRGRRTRPWIGRAALASCPVGVYASAPRVTGQAPGGLGAPGARSASRVDSGLQSA